MNLVTFHICICALTLHHVAAPITSEGDGDALAGGTEVPNENEKGANNVFPLVHAVYLDGCKNRSTMLTDLEIARNVNLKLPYNDVKLKYIVLLCPKQYKNTNIFSIIRVLKEIKEDDVYPMCPKYLQPLITHKYNLGQLYSVLVYFEHNFEEYKPLLSDQKIKNQELKSLELKNKNKKRNLDDIMAYKPSSSDQKTKTQEWKSLLAKFKEEIYGSDIDSNKENYMEIFYDFDLIMPRFIDHSIQAHMHSNDYDKKCDHMLGLEKLNEKNIPVAIFEKNLDAYEWRQLVTQQDFLGKYPIAASCNYFNYILLHKTAIETLKELEEHIKKVADIIGRIEIITGTYGKISDHEKPSIPKILWKRITHFTRQNDIYSVLMIIHNENTSKLCNDNQKIDENLGWPKRNPEGESIGTMYYCQVDQSLVKELSNGHWYAQEWLDNENVKKNYPFDLNRVPVTTENDEIIHVNVTSKIDEQKNIKLIQRKKKIKI